MTKLEQLDLIDALAARDKKLAEVAENHAGWGDLAAAEMQHIEDGVEGIFEDFRRMLLERGVPPPKHANAWGAFAANMKRRRFLVRTGAYRFMRVGSSHGRESPVYVKRTPLE